MAWVKGLHIVAIIMWSASLICLPILMAGHSSRMSTWAYERQHGMVRQAYLWVASPFAIFAIVSGTILIPMGDVTAPWFAVKLLVVAMLAVIHARCGVLLARLSHRVARAHIALRVLRITAPIVFFSCVLWLVLAKPVIPVTADSGSSFLIERIRPLLRPLVLRTPASRPASLQSTPAKNLVQTAPGPRGRWQRQDRAAA